MAVQYRVNFKTAQENQLGDWFRPQGLGATMERVRERMKRWNGPFRQKERDGKDDWGPWREFSDAALQFRRTIEHAQIGDVWAMEPKDTEDAFLAVRKVSVIEVNYPSISSNATPRTKAIVRPLWTEFPQLQYWGCYNCRHIAGSSSWSEHSWADAIDVHPPTMVYGDQANRWLMANRGRFDITRVLWRVANHFDHLHIDFDPDHSGTPPCA